MLNWWYIVTTGLERDISGTRIQCPVPSAKDGDLNGLAITLHVIAWYQNGICFLKIPSCDNCGCPLASRVDFYSFFYLFMCVRICT